MDVIDIISEYLKANGYDGLYNEDEECGCAVGDLMPCCDGLNAKCKAGYKVNCTEACDEWHDYVEGGWHIQAKKPEIEKGE